jgi:signal recognition particle subunit SRP54
MFDNLTERLSQSLRNVAGTGKLTEDNIKDTLREVRMALLEADVALAVVKEFIERIRSSSTWPTRSCSLYHQVKPLLN